MTELFRFPIRTSQAMGLDEPEGTKKSDEDIAADLDLIDIVMEDRLSEIGSASSTAGRGTREINVQTTTTYTLVSGDVGKVVEMVATTTSVVNVPSGFSTGAEVVIVKTNTPGATTIQGVGVTVSSAISLTLAQYEKRTIYKSNATRWIVGY